MPRRPQLGDTNVHFGGEPLPQVDATFPAQMRPKGLGNSEPASEDEALLAISGGPSTATLPLPEKNILQTDEPSQFSNADDVEQATPASLSWTNGEVVRWVIRHEDSGTLSFLDTYGAADAYFDAHERTRWMVPGQDEVVGWKPVENATTLPGEASAASDTSPVGTEPLV
jgi:hypothetical protein